MTGPTVDPHSIQHSAKGGADRLPPKTTGTDHPLTEDAMRHPNIDDQVCLTQDIPELELTRGDRGIVRSTWFAPTVVYEVEFHQIGSDYDTRALLREEQMEVDTEDELSDDVLMIEEIVVPQL